MKWFKEVFARIWAFWGLITFVVTFILIFPFSMIAYLIPHPYGQRYFMFISRIWMIIWLSLILCPVKIYGWRNFKKGKNYIVVFNHNTFLDVPLSSPFVKGANKTIAKDTFKKIPLFGWFYARGSVLVNRNSEASRSESFMQMQNVLKKGMHMCIYPEGTRNRTDQPLKSFYDGAFKLAVTSQHDILPCIIHGTKDAMPIHKPFYLFPTLLRMQFLPPISTANKSVDDLKKETFNVMLEELQNPLYKKL